MLTRDGQEEVEPTWKSVYFAPPPQSSLLDPNGLDTGLFKPKVGLKEAGPLSADS